MMKLLKYAVNNTRGINTVVHTILRNQFTRGLFILAKVYFTSP